MKTIACVGCGADVPDIDGATHKYLIGSPGCWKVYGDVLAKDYGDQEYMKVHRLTVDAYALQHIGVENSQTIQSMNVHLISLCAALQEGMKHEAILEIMSEKVEKHKHDFFWLNPPQSLGDITVLDVAKAETVEEHHSLVRGWANEVWQRWSEHHELILSYLKK